MRIVVTSHSDMCVSKYTKFPSLLMKGSRTRNIEREEANIKLARTRSPIHEHSQGVDEEARIEQQLVKNEGLPLYSVHADQSIRLFHLFSSWSVVCVCVSEEKQINELD